MKCPNCEAILVMSERQGVEIDYCPKCRGVWLDKGELDKIIEKSAENELRSLGSQQRPPEPSRDQYQQPYQHPHHQKYRKKKGFLGDFFDFD